MAATPYDHLLDSASSLDDEALADFIDDLQFMLEQRSQPDEQEEDN